MNIKPNQILRMVIYISFKMHPWQFKVDPVGTEIDVTILFICFYERFPFDNFKEKDFLIQCDLNYDIIHALMIQIIDEMESFLRSIISFASSLFSTTNTYICNRLELVWLKKIRKTVFYTYQYFGWYISS